VTESSSLKERYGPWAVIAGASEGVGREFARQLAAAGVHCILIARRAEPLDALAREILEESGVECVAAAIDLAADDALQRIIAAVGEREVGLYIHNAGADPNGARFLDRDIDHWLTLTKLNVLAAMRNCHHFAAPMRARGRGGIILVGSGACYSGGNFMAAYSASKAFELCFGEGLWAELRAYHVDVLYMVLGTTDTPALRALLASKGMPVPTGLASPESVAAAGLARLPFGPVYNYGFEDEESGFAPTSASARRARILAIDEVSKHIFGDS
jgi:short-subunit dehydrogenase